MPAPWLRLAVALFAVSWGANQFAPMQLVYSRHLGLTSGSFTAMLAPTCSASFPRCCTSVASPIVRDAGWSSAR